MRQKKADADAERLDRREPKPDEGLTFEEVEERVKGGFRNDAVVKVEKSYGRIVFDNVFTFFGCVLFAIAVVFLVFRIWLTYNGHADLAEAYFGISKFGYLFPLFLNIVIGIIQECRSKKVLDKLRIVADSKYAAVRNGVCVTVHSDEIVLDDIIELTAGQQIPADLKLVKGYVEVNESLLTGESDTVKKNVDDTLMSGSSVVVGTGRFLVTAVGKDTYVNRLQKKVKKISKNKSELMRNIYGIINAMSVILVIIVAVVVGTMIYKIGKWGADPSVFITDATKATLDSGLYAEMLASGGLTLNSPYSWSVIITTASAFAIGVIPTGLVLLTSMTLAVSVIDLAKKKTLIQELYSLENLSRIDTICLDKTGTLTDGSMSVAEIIYANNMSQKEKREAASLLGSFLGAMPSSNQTSIALTKRFPVNKLNPVKGIMPFSSARKQSEVVFSDGRDCILGAPEYILAGSDTDYLTTVNMKASEGYRVLAFTVCGSLDMLICLRDNIRPSAPSTIAYFNENGVGVKIISGDNPVTVKSIAAECGVERCELAVSLEGIAVEDVAAMADQFTIFGRVSPEQKEALVTALQKDGHKVAMTGDGVNDILALRKANSSISFQNATDAAKSCSDVVLLDNDFGHLKDVVSQGRRVVNNIQRTAILFLMKTFCIAMLAFFMIPFKKGQTAFTIENIYLMQTSVIAISGFLLSVENCRKPITGSFKTTVYSKALASGLLMAIGALVPCVLSVSWGGSTPILSADNARSLISILTTIAGFTVLFKMCVHFTPYRVFVYAVALVVTIVVAMAFPTIYVGGQSWSLAELLENGSESSIFHNFFNIHNDVFSAFTVPVYVIIGCFVAIALPLYIFGMKGIDYLLNKQIIAKIDAQKAKNKPNNQL